MMYIIIVEHMGICYDKISERDEKGSVRGT